MILSDVAKAISKYAPLLGTVVGGPAGAAIGTLVATAFGADPNNPEDILARIQADPEASVKLVEIQSNTKVELQRIAMQTAQNQLQADNQKFDIQTKDVQDARRENVISKSCMPQIISFIVMVGFFFCMYIILAFKQDAEDEKVLYLMIGTVSAAFGAVIQYWIGSSAKTL